MSAMSASSPPAGLMPLSLIAEHKSTVPQSVQPLARTEKMAQPNIVPVVAKPNVAVANGMEMPVVSNPVPAPTVTPQPEISHPVTAIETTPPPPLPTPPTNQPNLPCGGKAESSQPEFPTNDKTNQSEESVAEAVVPPMMSQLPVSAAVVVAPPPAPVVVQPVIQPAAIPEPQIVKEEEKAAVPTAPAVVPEIKEPKELHVAAQPKAASPQPSPQPPSEESKPEPPTPAPTEASLPSPAQPATSPSPVPEKVHKAEKVKAEKPPRAKRPPKPKAEKKPEQTEEPEEDDDKKPKRKRLPTQIYQAPIPELNIIAKISKIEKPASKPEDKLIVFYKNEFLAVRNTEGSFYVCQAMQNIYRSSSKIKIRWLSQQPNSEFYSPDFYDHTEFDCILTTLSLKKVEKDKFILPKVESQRTESILKRAIDVEKGLITADDSVTEEHPDGLDLSLYRNEDQLKRKEKGRKRKTSGSPRSKARRKKKAKPTKEEVVKKIAARTTKKREPTPPPVPAPSTSTGRKTVASKKAVAAPPPKKEAAPKKEAKASGKRKGTLPAPSSPIPEKKVKKDPPAKKKILTAIYRRSDRSS